MARKLEIERSVPNVLSEVPAVIVGQANVETEKCVAVRDVEEITVIPARDLVHGHVVGRTGEVAEAVGVMSAVATSGEVGVPAGVVTVESIHEVISHDDARVIEVRGVDIVIDAVRVVGIVMTVIVDEVLTERVVVVVVATVVEISNAFVEIMLTIRMVKINARNVVDMVALTGLLVEASHRLRAPATLLV
jgi:hypothetical protein